MIQWFIRVALSHQNQKIELGRIEQRKWFPLDFYHVSHSQTGMQSILFPPHSIICNFCDCHTPHSLHSYLKLQYFWTLYPSLLVKILFSHLFSSSPSQQTHYKYKPLTFPTILLFINSITNCIITTTIHSFHFQLFFDTKFPFLRIFSVETIDYIRKVNDLIAIRFFLIENSGSRRPSLASVHSTSSSIRSYGAMRLDKEKEQKEMRHEMKLRLTRLQQQQQMIQNRPHIVIGDSLIHCGAIPKTIALTTPSPLTPNSLDELLPCVIESQEASASNRSLEFEFWFLFLFHLVQPSPPVKLKRNETYGKSSATLREDFLDWNMFTPNGLCYRARA